MRALQAHGYEPGTEHDAIVLANCPFHSLAHDHTELVCGMNRHLLRGLLDSFAPTGLTALLAPAPAAAAYAWNKTTPRQVAPTPPDTATGSAALYPMTSTPTRPAQP